MIASQSKVNGLLGLAAKAGKIISGADAVEEMVIKKKVSLVIIAQDTSTKTKEKFLDLVDKYNILSFEYGTIEGNSKCIGKMNKAIIGIKDKSFSDAIYKIINGGDTIGQN